MKKEKEWAQKEVDRYLSYEGVNEARNALMFAKGVINQLDEPEITEEQAWSKIKLENHYHIAPAYVEVYEKAIKRGIKPEYFNETEKPVIPQIVADYIKDCEEQAIHWFEAMDGIASDYYADKEDERTKKAYEWVMRNPDKFVDAFRNGYEVEKDPLYYVKKFSETNYLYFNRINVYDGESYNYDSSAWKTSALKFPKGQAQALATFVGGEIEEVTERKLNL